LQELVNEYDVLLKVCDVGNQYDAQLLYDRFLNSESPIDRGEAEVIIQARERGVLEVLIDDKEGRKIATRHTLTVRGTLGVLIEFKKLDIVKEIKPLVETLGSKLRISSKLLREELEKIREDYE
jgi:predicted nucleic acid-binding protein